MGGVLKLRKGAWGRSQQTGKQQGKEKRQNDKIDNQVYAGGDGRARYLGGARWGASGVLPGGVQNLGCWVLWFLLGAKIR